ncbi:MAG: SPOR domain-containing protein, partial [Nitrospirae bacterium]
AIERFFALVFIALTVSISFSLGYMLGSSGQKPEKRTIVSSIKPHVTESLSHELPKKSPEPPVVKKNDTASKPLRTEVKPDEKKLKEALLETAKKEERTKGATAVNKEREEKPVNKKIPVVQKKSKRYHYSIQVGAFRERSEAEALQERLQSKGYSVNIISPYKKNGFYRVRLGRYKDKKTAETIALKLARTEKLSPLVVKEND